ncbi:MAG: ribonuclease PH [Zavarzinella sp.]
MPYQRQDGRQFNELRPINFELNFTKNATGSVLVRCGNTVVLCTCQVENSVPPFLVGKGTGWLTAEYGMLPGSTHSRKQRDKAGKVDGRSVEIQRLIGRSLRAVVDLSQLGERTLWLDCDVLQADGGTRTTAINGAFVALYLALANLKETLPPITAILTNSVAAVSVGIVEETAVLDLPYVEDRDAAVDMNIVMTGKGEFIEVQGTGEETTFTGTQLQQMLQLGQDGIAQIAQLQRASLGELWQHSC